MALNTNTNRRAQLLLQYDADAIVFNVEVLHTSRTAEGKRDGRWVEINAVHVLDQLEGDRSHVRIVCEPRDDISMRCHFTDRNCCFECRTCVEGAHGQRVHRGLFRQVRGDAPAAPSGARARDRDLEGAHASAHATAPRGNPSLLPQAVLGDSVIISR